MRVLLLARSAGEWWDQLIASSGARLSETLAAAPVITLGPLTPRSGQAEVYRQALEAFAAELEMDCPPAGLPLIGPDAVALVIHAAALLAVLNHGLAQAPDRAGSDRDDVIGGLLRHEARYWHHSQARYGLNLGPAVTERAVAAGTLAGAGDETSATRLLAAIGDLADQGLRGKVARWLHDLYPARTPGTAPGEWIGPLRPDLVAENLVVKALTRQPQMISALLGGLPGNRATRALTILARAALTSPVALDLRRSGAPGHGRRGRNQPVNRRSSSRRPGSRAVARRAPPPDHRHPPGQVGGPGQDRSGRLRTPRPSLRQRRGTSRQPPQLEQLAVPAGPPRTGAGCHRPGRHHPP